MADSVPLREYFEALRSADDRRYAEVAAEREKALKIKETADEKALDLARIIQTYKDEKANELREQINSERGSYVTNKDFEVVKSYMASQTGRSTGIGSVGAVVLGVCVALSTLVSATSLFVALTRQ